MSALFSVEARYDTTNASVLAVLGLIDLAAGIDAAFTADARAHVGHPSTAVSGEPVEPVDLGEFELGVLGLISVGRLLGDLGANTGHLNTLGTLDTEANAPEQSMVSQTWSAGDVLW